MSVPSQAVILAGGLGLRLRPITLSIPKPMVPINGKPFLQYQLELLKLSGFVRILLLVGYLSHKIEDYFGDGHIWDVDLTYCRESSPMGTAGALKHAVDMLDDNFLLVNGDTYLPLDYARMVARFSSLGKAGLMAVYENSDRVAQNNVRVSQTGLIERYSRVPAVDLTHVDAGAYVLSRSVLGIIDKNVVAGLEGVYPSLSAGSQLAAFPTSERFYDIGTFDRLVAAGKVLL